MLKKSITYTDYNENEITEDFYFNFTKLELLEKELAMGGIEETLKRLMETQNTEEAYSIFKSLILAAFGKKSADGKRFMKSPEIQAELEESPALSELIIEFLNDPTSGASFMEATLPTKLVEQVKAAEAEANKAMKAASKVELPTAEPELESKEKSERVWNPEAKYSDYTKEELLSMPQEHFDRLVGKDPIKMSHEQLLIATQRRNQQ